jgi:hypothetical protein
MTDLTDILFQERQKPRGDEREAHAADLYDCDLKTWFRRNGFQRRPFTKEKQAQFAQGHGYEKEVGHTLAKAGHDVVIDSEVSHLGITGHPDVIDLTDNNLIECKTTMMRKPTGLSKHHAIQAAFYALAKNLPKAIVLVSHFGSWEEVAYELDPEDYRATIERRAKEVLERTEPGTVMPDPGPFDLADYDLCKYCDFTQCGKNPNHG